MTGVGCFFQSCANRKISPLFHNPDQQNSGGNDSLPDASTNIIIVVLLGPMPAEAALNKLLY